MGNSEKKIQEYIKKALKSRDDEFANLHGSKDWKYSVAYKYVDADDKQEKSATRTYIKVGPHEMDDLEYEVLPDGRIEVNYAEPLRFFDSVEQAYTVHNKFFVLVEDYEV